MKKYILRCIASNIDDDDGGGGDGDGGWYYLKA